LLVAALALSSLTALPGCVLLAVGAGAGAVGYMAGQERTPSENARDIGIRSKIQDVWDASDRGLTRDIGIDVYDGRVLLTGRVPQDRARDEATRLAWQVANVRAVYNEVEVGPPTTTGRDLRDTEITAKLRSQLTFDSQVRSLNFTINTFDGNIYLLGSGRSQEEIDRVTNYARNISGVKRVVNYIEIRSGTQQNAGPAPVMAPAPAPGPAPVMTPSYSSQPPAYSAPPAYSSAPPTYNQAPSYSPPAQPYTPPPPTGGIQVTPLN